MWIHPSICSCQGYGGLLKLIDDGLGDVRGRGVACRQTVRTGLRASRSYVPPKSAVLTLPSFNTSYTDVAMALACFSRLQMVSDNVLVSRQLTHPRCRSNMLPDKIMATGLALLVPMMSLPMCRHPGSKRAYSYAGVSAVPRSDSRGTHSTNVATGDDTGSTDESGTDVRGDVTVQVGHDHDVELLGFRDQLHRAGAESAEIKQRDERLTCCRRSWRRKRYPNSCIPLRRPCTCSRRDRHRAS